MDKPILDNMVAQRAAQFNRRERPLDPGPRPPKPSEEGGPTRPETSSPSKDSIMKRMKKVDPKQAERYRQRTGE